MHNYFIAIDSFPRFDTLGQDFKLLKAYHRNDTLYLRKSYQELIASLRTWDNAKTTTTCESPRPMRLLEYDEAYRFMYMQSFCDTMLFLTLGRWESEYEFEVMLEVYDSAGCRTIKQLKQKLERRIWDQLIAGLHYADYWGMESVNGHQSLDGSALYVLGFQKRTNKQKVIYRWAAERTAIGTVFKDAMNATAANVSCFGFNRQSP